jgi:hypothetical protein
MFRVEYSIQSVGAYAPTSIVAPADTTIGEVEALINEENEKDPASLAVIRSITRSDDFVSVLVNS